MAAPEWLVSAAAQRGMQAKLAKVSGIKPDIISKILSGTRNISLAEAEALRSAIAQLRGGNGAAEESLPEGNVRPAPLPPKADRAHKVPVLGTAEAGGNGLFEFNVGEPIDFRDRPPALVHRPKVYCIYVSGDSMSPIHDAGDLLFIDGGRTPFPGRDALIELHPEHDGDNPRAFIKRLIKVTPEFIEVKELQPKERTFKIQRSRIRNLHLVLKNTDMY
jgi:phage repressor protein C with HTH and peptisase S24 domain